MINNEITRTQRLVMELYEKQRSYLTGKPRQFVEDLLHEADDLRFHETFTLHTAAEINRTACMMVLEAKP